MLHDFMFNFPVEFENKQKKLGCHLKKSKNHYLLIVKNKLRLKHPVEDILNKMIKKNFI